MRSQESEDRTRLARGLFVEKNLFDVHRTYSSAFPFPLRAFGFGFLAVVFTATLCFALSDRLDSGQIIGNIASKIFHVTIQLSSVIFGVAIAGFAIFATSMRQSAALKMARGNYPGTSVPVVRFLFVVFVHILFVLLLVYPTWFVFEVFFSVDRQNIAVILGVLSDRAWYWINSFWFCYSVMQFVIVFSFVVSFIWNLFQILLVIVGMQIVGD